MNTLLTTIIVGQLLLSSVAVLRVLSFSETRRLPILSGFLVMSWLLNLLLVVIWFNLSFFMASSQGQEVTWKYTPLTETVHRSPVKSRIWLLTEKPSISCPNILALPSPKS